MNIGQTRISRGGERNVINHVHKADENDSVRVLEGDVEEMLLEAPADARALGRKKTLRHFTINPDEELTDDQCARAIQMIRDEFDLGDRPIYLVEHIKMRSDGSKVPHYHLITPETWGAGPELSSNHFKRRNEKLARKMEIAFGHELTKGKHNKAVQNAFGFEGNHVAAEIMNDLTKEGPALSNYGEKAHQRAKRLGVDLPSISESLKQLQGVGPAGVAKGLAWIAEEHGVIVDSGDLKDVILIRNENGDVLHNANRSLKIKAKDVGPILENFREGQEYRRPAIVSGTVMESRKLSGPVAI